MDFQQKGQWIQLFIDQKLANKTIEDFFKTFYLSKKQIHDLRMGHQVYLNNQAIKQNFTIELQNQDQLSFPFFTDEAIDFIPEEAPLDIVYEDHFMLVVNKPTPLLIHPSDKAGTGTLVNRVAYYYKTTKQYHRIRYIHRLDEETSGLIVFAKTAFIHRYFDHLLANKVIKRDYLAIVEGIPQKQQGVIEGYLASDRHHPSRRRVSTKGDYAKTYYQLIKSDKVNHRSLIHCQLATGRTHQIRVHLSSIGLPILGDALYNPKKTTLIHRQALHAYRIKIPHPFTEQQILLEVDLPHDMKELL